MYNRSSVNPTHGSEYEDEDDAEEEGDAGLENTYYTAKSVKEDDPDQAIKKLEALVDQETEKGDWCVKMLKPYACS
jgi:COP9 signalosome complex subunit 2